MRTIVAVAGRVFVQCMRDHFDDHLEVFFVTKRNVRIERITQFFKLDDRDESGRSCLAIEAEYQFLICPADPGHSFSRLRGF